MRRAALLAALLLAACGDRPAPAGPAPPPAPPLPAEDVFLAQIDKSRGWKDVFTPLVDPPFVAAAEAPGMTDGEQVVGLDLGDAQVCYPTRLLDLHEIVEHRLAGLELLACW